MTGILLTGTLSLNLINQSANQSINQSINQSFFFAHSLPISFFFQNELFQKLFQEHRQNSKQIESRSSSV